VRESALSWKELLLDLKRRGLDVAPELAIADGALGFWKALGEVWGKTRKQRCWVHKTANVLNKLPKSIQRKAKIALQNIWMADTKAAFDHFAEVYGAKSDKAVACLTKDRSALLAFYDFPAEHWKHPLPRRSSILPFSIHTICSFAWLCGSTWTPASMLHHTIIPCSPERMRRLIFSLICSSSRAANVPKPTSVDITSSQIRIALGAARSMNAQLLSFSKVPPRRHPHFLLSHSSSASRFMVGTSEFFILSQSGDAPRFNAEPERTLTVESGLPSHSVALHARQP
jgi:hypothetical protein